MEGNVCSNDYGGTVLTALFRFFVGILEGDFSHIYSDFTG